MVFNFGLDGAGRGVAHGDRLSHFLQHGGLIKGKKVEEGGHIIWCAVTWLLRNKIIFKGGVASSSFVLSQIKVA